MDFDYIEDYRPSLRLQSGSGSVAGAEELIIDRKHAGICILSGLILLFLSAWLKAAGVIQLILCWLAVSLFLGPFAPGSVTAGDCRVGQGEALAPVTRPDVDPVEAERRHARSRKKTYRAAEPGEFEKPVEVLKQEPAQNGAPQLAKRADGVWSEEEIGMLRKQLAKHPRGTARRWQVIAESFNGSRTVDDVILAAKDCGGRKPGDGDSYAKFLAQRKVSSKQIASDATLRAEFEGEDGEVVVVNGNGNGSGNGWSDAEDKALLGALKAIPKDTGMRWERVAEAVAGRSKAQCLKRYSELKDAFRSSKNVAEQ